MRLGQVAAVSFITLLPRLHPRLWSRSTLGTGSGASRARPVRQLASSVVTRRTATRVFGQRRLTGSRGARVGDEARAGDRSSAIVRNTSHRPHARFRVSRSTARTFRPLTIQVRRLLLEGGGLGFYCQVSRLARRQRCRGGEGDRVPGVVLLFANRGFDCPAWIQRVFADVDPSFTTVVLRVDDYSGWKGAFEFYYPVIMF